MTAIADIVRHTLARKCRRKDRDVADSCRLVEDLDLDDLDRLDVVMDIERELGVVLPDEEFRVATAGELIAVFARLAAGAGKAAA